MNFIKPTSRFRLGVFAFWFFQALVVASFHEPWRDEAQAWLATRSASTFTELLYHGSLELTGPLYYSLIWPFARTWPAAFPSLIFCISFAGTASLVGLLLFTKRIPFWMAVLTSFGFLFGYEFAVVARLYGWGLFFLSGGILADLNKKRSLSILAFSLVCLTQVTLIFGVLAWVLARILEKKSRKQQQKEFLLWSWLIIPVIIVLMHLKMAEAVRLWSKWDFHISLDNLGTNLITGFVQSPGRIGASGILLAFAVFYPLKKNTRIALGISLILFILMFLGRSRNGAAYSRHAAALFTTWLWFFALHPLKSNWPKRIVFGILAMSVCSGLWARAQEIRLNYSDGAPAAEQISDFARDNALKVKLFTQDPLYAFVTMARLDTPVYSGFAFERIDHPALTQALESRKVLEGRNVPWAEYLEHCAPDEACFVIFRPTLQQEPPPELAAHFEVFYRETATITDETLRVYRLR